LNTLRHACITNGQEDRSAYELDGCGVIGSGRREEAVEGEEVESHQRRQRQLEEEEDDHNVSEEVETFYNSLRQEEEETKKQKQLTRSATTTTSYDEDFETISPRAFHLLPHAISSASRDDDSISIKPSLAHKTVSKRLSCSSSASVDSHDSSSPPAGIQQYIRVSYLKIYDSIFLAKDTIPQAILLMQLRAMLKVHNFTSNEIEELINKEVKGNNSISINSSNSGISGNSGGKIRKEVGRVPSTPTHISSSSSSYRQMEVITPRSAASAISSSHQTPPFYPSSSVSNFRPSTPQRPNSRQSVGGGAAALPTSENRSKSNSRGGLSSSFSSQTADQPEIIDQPHQSINVLLLP
jgi:hypothetical protein